MPRRWNSKGWLSDWRAGALLPLVGVFFWLTTGWVNQQVLSQTYGTDTQLQAAGQHQVQLSLDLTIVSIDASLDRTAQVSEVSIRAIGATLEEMRFKFPLVDSLALEQAIAQELGLAVTEIHDLIRYRINK